MVPSLAVTETRVPRAHSPARLLEQALLLVALLSLVLAVVVGFVPVTNPGVQSCGSPFVFSWHTSNDVVLPAPGSAEAPANDLQLLAQEPCHQRVDSRLLISGLAVVVTVVAGLAGALIGLFDDRSRYRASPRFELYLRERPPEAPSDPWDQPVIPEHDLGERLPDIEWREVRVVVWVGILAVVLLAWLGPWSDVRDAVEHVRLGWVVVAAVLVALTYPLAAGGVVAATDGSDGRRRPFAPVLATSVASSFTGRLLPEYGPAGLAVHQLVREGQDRRERAGPPHRPRHGVAVGAHGAARPRQVLSRPAPPGPAATPSTGSGCCGWPCSSASSSVWSTRLVATPRCRASRPTLAGAARSHDRRPVRVAGMVASALALALVNGLVVLVAARAFGTTSAAPVLFVGLLIPVVVVVAPTPDGAGLVEACLVVGLIWAGMARARPSRPWCWCGWSPSGSRCCRAGSRSRAPRPRRALIVPVWWGKPHDSATSQAPRATQATTDAPMSAPGAIGPAQGTESKARGHPVPLPNMSCASMVPRATRRPSATQVAIAVPIHRSSPDGRAFGAVDDPRGDDRDADRDRQRVATLPAVAVRGRVQAFGDDRHREDAEDEPREHDPVTPRADGEGEAHEEHDGDAPIRRRARSAAAGW